MPKYVKKVLFVRQVEKTSVTLAKAGGFNSDPLYII